jgi:hypothetical protein
MRLALVSLFAAASASAAEPKTEPPCPAARDLPQLMIDNVRDPVIPVIDDWQVFWGDVPLSDAQVAKLSGEDLMIDRTTEEMASRGQWVYISVGLAAGGSALSSIGWVLYGQNNLSQNVTLPMAAGGLVLGVLGLLAVTESVQTPLEPHLAPTPKHRISREEMRRLVTQINKKLFKDICAAAEAARKP